MNARLSLALLMGAIALAAFPPTGAFAGNTERPFVTVTSPHMDECVPGPNVNVALCAGGICLQPCGNNVHLMLDDEPFEVQFDPTHPHIFHDVAPGTHTIRAYLANSMHEGIAGTLDVITFSVAYPNDSNRLSPGAAVLTYCLPQGEYLGIDCADIAVSFLVDGTQLSPRGYKVNYYVDGKRNIAYDTGPRHVQGLGPGYHTVKMELLDASNNLVPGPFNTAERTILLSPDKSMRSKAKNPKFPESPTLSSIHGSMTMGMPTVEKEEPQSLKSVKSTGLTVKHATPVPAGYNQDSDMQSLPNVNDSPTVVDFPAPAPTLNQFPPTDDATKDLDSLRNENPPVPPAPQIQSPDVKGTSVSRAIIRYTPRAAARVTSFAPANNKAVTVSAPVTVPMAASAPSAAAPAPTQVVTMSQNSSKSAAPPSTNSASTDTFEKEIPNAEDVTTSDTDPAPSGLFSAK